MDLYSVANVRCVLWVALVFIVLALIVNWYLYVILDFISSPSHLQNLVFYMHHANHSSFPVIYVACMVTLIRAINSFEYIKNWLLDIYGCITIYYRVAKEKQSSIELVCRLCKPVVWCLHTWNVIFVYNIVSFLFQPWGDEHALWGIIICSY